MTEFVERVFIGGGAHGKRMRVVAGRTAILIPALICELPSKRPGKLPERTFQDEVYYLRELPNRQFVFVLDGLSKEEAIALVIEGHLEGIGTP